MRRGSSLGRSAAIIGVLGAALCYGACAKEITTQPPPTGLVTALFDPSLAILPTPTDLAKDPTTGLLAVPVADATADPAQAEFDRYLNTLDGFPAASTVTVCFSADPLDNITLARRVTVLELPASTGEQPLKVTDVTALAPRKTLACPVLTETACSVKDRSGCTVEQRCVPTSPATAVCANAGYQVAFTKATPWKRGARYAFYVHKPVDPKTGQNGLQIIRSRAFELAAAPNPLCEFNATERKCMYNYSTLLASQVKAALTAENDAKRAAGDATALATEELEKAIRAAVLASATRFELLRQAHDQVLAASGIPRDDIVLAWFFSITSQVEAVFDPTQGLIPGPGNDLVLAATTGKVDIPARPGETAADKALREGLNALDGFSTTATYYTTFSGKLDATRIKNAANAIDLIAINTADPTEVVQAAFSWSDNAGAILFKPLVPLKENTRYAVLLRSRGNADPKNHKEAVAASGGLVDSSGRRIVASPIFALARQKNALIDKDGKATVSTLDDASAKTLEAVRASYDPLLRGLEANPAIVPALKREDVVIAWTFKTQSITAPLTKLRALPYSILAAVDSDKPTFEGGVDPTLAKWRPGVPKDQVGGFGQGTFQTWIALDPKTGAFLADPTKGAAVAVPFYISLPKLADCSAAACSDASATCADLVAGPPPAPTGVRYCVPAKLPVVVFQHGFTRAKEDFFAVANALNGAGFAVLAFDINYHGERSICLDDKDCVATASCSAARRCCDKTTPADCQTSYFLDADKNGVPDVSGGPAFVNTDNPFAIRDNLRQHVIDSAAFLRAIALDASSGLQWPLIDVKKASTMVPLVLDQDNINWASQSLGSILGTLVLATDSTIKRAVLNVPGAPLVDIFDGTKTPSFIALIEGLLDARGLCKVEGGKKVCPHDSLGALQLFHTLQWIVDPGDAANFARYVKTEQLKDEVLSAPGSDVKVTKKEVIMQVAGQDNVIPSALQKSLAGWMGVDITDTTYASNDHGFLLSPSPDLPSTAAAQTQLAKFLLFGTVCKPDTTSGQCN